MHNLNSLSKFDQLFPYDLVAVADSQWYKRYIGTEPPFKIKIQGATFVL